jgi:RNA polymerase sigma factor (sigma-70 family)
MSGTSTKVLRQVDALVKAHRLAPLSDGQLLERFVAHRDEAAFTLLVRRHGPMVLGVCRRVMRHEQDAEDVFQAAFLVLARRAGALRQSDAGGFLYRVAYHLAVRAGSSAARRRRRDRQGGGLSTVDPQTSTTWQEVHQLVDEELQRLPEDLRAALVLCYLEGKTLDEAARLLAWSKSTLRRRLTRGRELLRSRLVSRGLTPTAALAATLFAEGKSAAVSAALAAATVRCALDAASIRPAVAALVEAGTALLPGGRTKAAAALVLALGLLGGGVFMCRGLATPAAAQPSPPPRAADTPAPARKRHEEAAVVIHGRVFGPGGKPTARARVYVDAHWPVEKALASTATAEDGAFSFTLKRLQLVNPQSGFPLARVGLVATAPGCGPDWRDVPLTEAGKEVTLRLVKDDVPIQGRILSLEGKPQTGVKVRLYSLQAFSGEDVSRALLGMRKGINSRTLCYPPRAPTLTPTATTDDDGRFLLHGVGHERIATLHLEGAGIHYSEIRVMTRRGEAIREPEGDAKVYGATFEYLARPARLIRGTVRENGTGKPLAGIRVSSLYSTAQATTDAQGRYQLPGCPKGERYGVLALPPDGEPFFISSVSIKDTPGLEPLSGDVEMVPGILCAGKVLDARTGQPVEGMVNYAPLRPNPNVRGSFGTAAVGLGSPSEAVVKADGSFQCVVLPGPGALTFRAQEPQRYQSARVDTRTIKADGGTEHLWILFGNGHAAPAPQEQFQAIVLIDPDKGTKKLTRTIRLAGAREVQVTILDGDGKPVAGARVRGQHWGGDWTTLPTEKLTVQGLSPKRPRQLLVLHARRRLIGSLEVKGTETKPLTVRLVPWASLKGRLYAEGRPMRGAELQGNPSLSEKVWTDGEGRFSVEGLLPGVSYDFTYEKSSPRTPGTLLKGFVAKPGEVRDLGEVRGKPFRQE